MAIPSLADRQVPALRQVTFQKLERAIGSVDRGFHVPLGDFMALAFVDGEFAMRPKRFRATNICSA